MEPPREGEAPGLAPAPRRTIPAPAPRREGQLEVSWESPEPEPAPGFLERHERPLLFSLLFIGLLLRLVPLLWGSVYYDSAQHSFHPDEPKLVRPLDDFPASLESYHDYRYPTLLPFAYGALWVPVGGALGLRDPAPSRPGDASYEAAQVFGRVLNVLLFGLGGLLLVWAFTRRLFGAGPALLALAATNVMGLPVTSMALVSPDLPAAVLLFAVFYLLSRAEGRPRLTVGGLVAVGVALGAAAATKYTSGIGLLGVVAVLGHAWRRRRIDGRRALQLGAASAAAALVTFLLFVPGVLYDTRHFLDSLAYEYRSKLLLGNAEFSLLPRAFLQNFPLWLMAAAVLGLALAPRLGRELSTRKSVVLPAAGAALAVYFVTSLRSFRPDYVAPFFPFVAMFAGVGLWWVLRLPGRGVGAAVVLLVLGAGTLQSAHWVTQRYAGDMRYRVEDWITQNLPPGPLGVAPSATLHGAGMRAPEGYEFVGVHGLPRYILVFKRRADMALDTLHDPEDARRRMVTFWGAERAAREFSMEPGKRRVGRLKEADLRFYEDVLLGMRRHWRYDLLVEFEPDQAPLDTPGRWTAIYERTRDEPGGPALGAVGER